MPNPGGIGIQRYVPWLCPRGPSKIGPVIGEFTSINSPILRWDFVLKSINSPILRWDFYNYAYNLVPRLLSLLRTDPTFVITSFLPKTAPKPPRKVGDFPDTPGILPDDVPALKIDTF